VRGTAASGFEGSGGSRKVTHPEQVLESPRHEATRHLLAAEGLLALVALLPVV
jgi:hypothetical protein